MLNFIWESLLFNFSESFYFWILLIFDLDILSKLFVFLFKFLNKNPIIFFAFMLLELLIILHFLAFGTLYSHFIEQVH